MRRGVATHGYLAHVLGGVLTKVVCRASPAPATQPATARGGVASTMSDEPWEDDFAKPGCRALRQVGWPAQSARTRSSPPLPVRTAPSPCVAVVARCTISRYKNKHQDTICKVLSTNWVCTAACTLQLAVAVAHAPQVLCERCAARAHFFDFSNRLFTGDAQVTRQVSQYGIKVSSWGLRPSKS